MDTGLNKSIMQSDCDKGYSEADEKKFVHYSACADSFSGSWESCGSLPLALSTGLGSAPLDVDSSPGSAWSVVGGSDELPSPSSCGTGSVTSL